MTNGEAEKIKQLEQDIKYWSTTAQNYLTTLQSEQAENENLKELLKNQSPGKINEEAEKSLIEANQKIRELEQIINKLKDKLQRIFLLEQNYYEKHKPQPKT
jgi:predicted RNase H-like nuclease (RuvC/YqgF family)